MSPRAVRADVVRTPNPGDVLEHPEFGMAMVVSAYSFNAASKLAWICPMAPLPVPSVDAPRGLRIALANDALAEPMAVHVYQIHAAPFDHPGTRFVTAAGPLILQEVRSAIAAIAGIA